MNKNEKITPALEHQQVRVKDISIHTVTAGMKNNPVILCLHGFPENWQAFQPVMSILQNEFYIISIDLPGIGLSGNIPSHDKKTIAKYIKGLIDELNLKEVTLAGHDAGGMAAYSYLRAYPGELAKAIIMNTVIPGVEPWTVVKQNPAIWHFTFHKIPELPETLVTGKEKIYFDYFFNTISKKREAIAEDTRLSYAAAYSAPHSLKTGFDWYRTFGQDEKDNQETPGRPVNTPVLYLRGEFDYGNIEDYLAGFRESGLKNVSGKIIHGSGHYAPEEASQEVADAIKEFIKN